MMKTNRWRAGLWLVFLLDLLLVAAPAQTADEWQFQDDDSLETLQAKIVHNGYSFTVGHNWVFDMPLEQKKRFFSRHQTRQPRVYGVSDDIGPLAEHLGKTLPASFDWRNYNGHSYIGRVRNQGYCGSCYAFAAAASAEGVYNLAKGLTDTKCANFSESFIIWCLGRLSSYNSHFFGCDGADYDYMELEALTKEGISREAKFPYTIEDPGSCTHWSDPRVKFSEWHRIPCSDVNTIKTAIMTYGAVDVAVYVTSAFEAYSGGIYQDTNTSCYSAPCDYTPTNHAVALVGWDDATQTWILRNSWGSSWGENGYMRIKFKSARVACEATYLVFNSPPGIHVASPVAGTDWKKGTTKKVVWLKNGALASNVKIELLKGGVPALTISSLTANDGKHNWTIPSTLAAAADYAVRITTADDAYSDTSELFTISEP